MVALLQQAVAAMAQLPSEEQEHFAEWILAELAEESRWQASFDASMEQLERLGVQLLADHRAGLTEPLDPDTL
jgi:hypothetical protein